MIAGKLTEVIGIYKLVTSTNEYGSVDNDYLKIKDTKAQVKYNSGNRVNQSDEYYNTSSITFIIRSYHQIDETMIITYNSRKYRIISIENNKQYNLINLITEEINE